MPNPYTASGAPRNPQVSLVDALLGAETLRRLRGAGSGVVQGANKMRMAASPAIMGTLKTTGRVVPYAAGITGILTALEELEDDRQREP